MPLQVIRIKDCCYEWRGQSFIVATSGCRVYVIEIAFQEKDPDCNRICKKDQKNPALTNQTTKCGLFTESK